MTKPEDMTDKDLLNKFEANSRQLQHVIYDAQEKGETEILRHHLRAEILKRMAERAAGSASPLVPAMFVMGDCYKCPACKLPLSGTPEGHLPDCVVRKATEANLKNDGWISPYADEPGSVSPQGDLLAALKAEYPKPEAGPFWHELSALLEKHKAAHLYEPLVDAIMRHMFPGSASTHGPRPRCPKCGNNFFDVRAGTAYCCDTALLTGCNYQGPVAEFFAAAPAEDTKEQK